MHHLYETRFGRLGTMVACASLALLGVVSLLLAGPPQGGRGESQENAKFAAGERPGVSVDPAVAGAENLSRAFRAAAKRVLPAVVVVKTSASSQPMAHFHGNSQDLSDVPTEDTEVDEDFEEGFIEEEFMHRPGLASGVIIDPAGVVLTNQHVIEDADEVAVLLPDGREFSVRQTTPVPGMDLAVLQLDSQEPLPAATLGDSDGLEIGDWILTIGCPLELEQTVSAGIISAKGRTVPEAGRTRLLQTDAAINPGSSGGPLVNLRGEVVGITAAIASEDGGYQGIGFAIPINLFKSHKGRTSPERTQR